MLVVLLVVAAFAGFIIYKMQPISENTIMKEMDKTEEKLSGRKLFIVDKEWAQVDGPETDASVEAAKNGEPYKDRTLVGANIVWDNSSSPNNIETLESRFNHYEGKLYFYDVVPTSSTRDIYDEKVEVNQNEMFNEFTSLAIQLDNIGKDVKLNDEEVAKYAEIAKLIAIREDNPAAYYLEELILNLQGKNPTLSSVFYLMEANRISTPALIKQMH